MIVLGLHLGLVAVLVVSSVAALTMAIGALVLGADADDDDGADGRDLSVAAVLLDTVADAAAAAGVAAAGGVHAQSGRPGHGEKAVEGVQAARARRRAPRLVTQQAEHLVEFGGRPARGRLDRRE